MLKAIVALVVVAAIAGAIGVGVYYATQAQEEAQVALPTPTPVATPQATPTPTPPGTTPVPTPTPSNNWQTYRDSELGFSFSYPPDLALTDVEGPGGLSERALDFGSQDDPSRGFVVSVSKNTKGLTLEQWAIEFSACRPESIQQGTLGGSQAIRCTREVIEGVLEPAVLAERAGEIFSISHFSLTDSEFANIIESFRFGP